MMTDGECWFCGRAVLPEDDANIHHLVPLRFHRNGGGNEFTNKVRVHVACHERFNAAYDGPMCRAKADEYAAYMEPLAWGRGIFAPKS